MPRFSGGRGKRRNFYRGPRKNERIRAREVRVIGPDSRQIGILPIEQARRLARDAGLDLVEISATARPPVCRILDYGKYMYEQSKRGKDKKAQSSAHKLKEIKLRVRIEQHDYMTKLRRAEDFLNHGNKVKITLTFRGRENEHKNIGFDVVKRAVTDLGHIGTPDTEPRLAGRNLTMIVAPLPENKRRLIYNHPHEVEPPGGRGGKGDAAKDDHHADDHDHGDEDAPEETDVHEDEDAPEEPDAQEDADTQEEPPGEGSEGDDANEEARAGEPDETGEAEGASPSDDTEGDDDGSEKAATPPSD